MDRTFLSLKTNMNTVSISTALTLPDGCPIESLQAQVSEVYKQREVAGGKIVQDALLVDGTGTQIKLCAWDHGDLSVYKGKEVILQAGLKGGLKVKVNTYKKPQVNEVSASKMVTFQVISSGTAPAPQSANPGRTEASGANYDKGASSALPVVVNGAKIGMAINCATEFMVKAGQEFDEKVMWETASAIVRISNRMEQGDIAPVKEVSTEQAPF